MMTLNNTAKHNLSTRLSILNEFKIKELAIFSRQFATMFDAGISPIQCIEVLCKEEKNTAIKQIYSRLYEDVEKGNDLSIAFGKQPKYFPKLFISMVELGEATGTLESVLLRMSNYYEKMYKLQSKAKSIMTYPLFVGVFSIVVIFLLLMFVIPTFTNLFQDIEQLPNSTKLLFNLSAFVCNEWLMLIVFGLVLVILLVIGCQTPFYKRGVDRIKLDLPIIGNLNQIVLSARFAQIVSTMCANGMPLIQAVEISNKVVDNLYLKSKFETVQQKLSNGEALSKSISEMNVFPTMLTNMIAIGEESGRLYEILDKTAHIYEDQVNTTIEKMMLSIQPVLIGILGAIVAFVILAIVPPMYEMMGYIS